MRNNLWHIVVEVVLPHLVRGALIGLAAALTALGVLQPGDGPVPVELVPRHEQSGSSSNKSLRAAQFSLRFSE